MYLYLLTEVNLFYPIPAFAAASAFASFECRRAAWEKLLLLPDISADRSFVMHLAQLFTRLQPAPVHCVISCRICSKTQPGRPTRNRSSHSPIFPRPAPPFRQLVAARTLRCRRFHAVRANLFVTAGQKG